MQQPDRFICISYSSIDFLIPHEEIDSAVGLRDFNLDCGADTGIYDLDELAAEFNEGKKETSIYTMIILKAQDSRQLSFVTTHECKVCNIPLREFSLFSEIYSERLKNCGILACNFTDSKLRFLLDIRKAFNYQTSTEELLEEL